MKKYVLSFEARYHGTCGSCDGPIKPGQQVRYDDNVLVHDNCTDAESNERPVVVCGQCWLTKPCGCEDQP